MIPVIPRAARSSSETLVRRSAKASGRSTARLLPVFSPLSSALLTGLRPIGRSLHVSSTGIGGCPPALHGSLARSPDPRLERPSLLHLVSEPVSQYNMRYRLARPITHLRTGVRLTVAEDRGRWRPHEVPSPLLEA